MVKKFMLMFLSICCAALCISNYSPCAYAAAAPIKAAVDKEQISAEDNRLEVKISLILGEPIRGMQGTLAYNSDALELVSTEQGEVFLGAVISSFDTNEEGRVNFSFAYGEEISGEMPLCGAVFRLKDDCALSGSEIRIKNIKLARNGGSEVCADVSVPFSIAGGEDKPQAGDKDNETAEIGGESGEEDLQAENGVVSGEKESTAQSGQNNSSAAEFEEGNGKAETNKNVSSAENTSLPGETNIVSALPNKFTDTAGHWAQDYISFAAAKGWVNGVSDDTFEPDRNITRAEFTKIISSMLMLSSDAENTFADVDSGAWYCPYVLKAAAAGLVTGDNGYFYPLSYITRAETAVIIGRITQRSGKSTGVYEKQFNDDAQIPMWAKDSVYAAAAEGILQGDNNVFNPASAATRAQTAAVMQRLYQYIIN